MDPSTRVLDNDDDEQNKRETTNVSAVDDGDYSRNETPVAMGLRPMNK